MRFARAGRLDVDDAHHGLRQRIQRVRSRSLDHHPVTVAQEAPGQLGSSRCSIGSPPVSSTRGAPSACHLGHDLVDGQLGAAVERKSAIAVSTAEVAPRGADERAEQTCILGLTLDTGVDLRDPHFCLNLILIETAIVARYRSIRILEKLP